MLKTAPQVSQRYEHERPVTKAQKEVNEMSPHLPQSQDLIIRTASLRLTGPGARSLVSIHRAAAIRAARLQWKPPSSQLTRNCPGSQTATARASDSSNSQRLPGP